MQKDKAVVIFIDKTGKTHETSIEDLRVEHKPSGWKPVFIEGKARFKLYNNKRKKIMTEKQIWARRRNWLILRLVGARSIFSWDNINFMEETIGKGSKEAYLVFKCDDAIDKLLHVLRKTIKD